MGPRLSVVETFTLETLKVAFNKLQWGHRLSVVETNYLHRLIFPGLLASMGPPPFGSGNA